MLLYIFITIQPENNILGNFKLVYLFLNKVLLRIIIIASRASEDNDDLRSDKINFKPEKLLSTLTCKNIQTKNILH